MAAALTTPDADLPCEGRGADGRGGPTVSAGGAGLSVARAAARIFFRRGVIVRPGSGHSPVELVGMADLGVSPRRARVASPGPAGRGFDLHGPAGCSGAAGDSERAKAGPYTRRGAAGLSQHGAAFGQQRDRGECGGSPQRSRPDLSGEPATRPASDHGETSRESEAREAERLQLTGPGNRPRRPRRTGLERCEGRNAMRRRAGRAGLPVPRTCDSTRGYKQQHRASRLAKPLACTRSAPGESPASVRFAGAIPGALHLRFSRVEEPGRPRRGSRSEIVGSNPAPAFG